MKRIFTCAVISLLSISFSFSQLTITNNNTNYTINFDSSVSGVNAGNFLGSGFSTSPSSGQLDADAWATTGLSDGSKDFGVNNTSGDHARGANNGGVSTGGIYGFDVGGGNRALAIQATGSDWTPGTLTLKLLNTSGTTITDMTIDYNVFIRNDQNRSNSFNLSISYTNSSYSGISSADYTSPQASTGTSWILESKNIVLSGLDIASGEDFYIRWAGSDAGGSGSRDEFALDDIVIGVSGATNECFEPIAQANNLNFGTVTSNSIQASFINSAADKFLVVQSQDPSLGAIPVDGIQYNSGAVLGNGEVLQYSSSSDINSLGLNENTEYYYFIFAANDNCTGGPDYLALNPLTGSISTSGGGTNYYDGIGNETCENLKTTLHNLINNHTVVSYSSLWTHYQTTDDHLNDSGNEVIVWDMYSDNPYGSENEFSFGSEQCGSYQSEGDCYNREHSFPKSWWGGSTSVPQYTDLFTVVPVDGWINGIRNNNPYGEIQGGTETHITNNGSALGSSSISIPGYSGSVFEPIDEYKGDLARGYFYMMTRYEDVIPSWENNTIESDAVLDGTSYPGFEQWMLDMLINWHNIDPVDTKEIERNEAIYSIQGNRNPFIDHPEYVNLVWDSCGATDTEAPTTPTNLMASNTAETTTDLNWIASNDNIAVTGYNIYQDGNYLTSSVGNAYSVNGLLAGTSYDFYVEAYDAAGNISNISNVVSVLTSSVVDSQAPSAPINLTASNTNENSTDLSWSASTDDVGVVAYDIYQNGSYLNTSTTTNYFVTGLESGTAYDFYVEAYDAAGNVSNPSNVASTTTDNPPINNEILGSYFETGWDGWQDGGNDCFRYSGTNSPEGSYSILLRDNSGVSSSMTSPIMDLTSYTSVNIQFSFRGSSMENNEDFWLRYFDGSSWQTIATYAKGPDFQNGINYTMNVSLSSVNYNFASNAQIRFQCDAGANNDKVYIDAIVVTGESNGSYIAPPSETQILETVSLELEVEEEYNELDKIETIQVNIDQLSVFPNPTSGVLNLEWKSDSDKNVELLICDYLGRNVGLLTIETGRVVQQDLTHLNNGIYILSYKNNEGVIKTKRFYLIK